MRILKWVFILLGVLAAIGIGWFLVNFVFEDEPERLSFEQRDEELADSTTTVADGTTDTTAAAATDGVDGTWTVTEGSEAGYRATEVLFGQDAVAIGRTSDVTGTMVIEGTTVTEGTWEVDTTTIKSDESLRDSQFHGRIMETGTFPTATFTLTAPLEFGTLPSEDEPITVTASGDLTVHGVTNSITFDLEARLKSGSIEVVGAAPIVWADYDIDDPSGGPAQVEDAGEMEFLIVFARA